jgi:hypothetical protein
MICGRRRQLLFSRADENDYINTCNLFLKNLWEAERQLQTLAEDENQRPVCRKVDGMSSAGVSGQEENQTNSPFDWASFRVNTSRTFIRKRMETSAWFKRFIVAHNRNVEAFVKAMDQYSETQRWTKQQTSTYVNYGILHISFKRKKLDSESVTIKTFDVVEERY